MTRPACGSWMPNVKEPCARKPGHGGAHRSAFALASDSRRQPRSPRLTPSLGPCPCQGCGRPVWYGKARERPSGMAWRNADFERHYCKAAERAA